jgi:hypothetical protein
MASLLQPARRRLTTLPAAAATLMLACLPSSVSFAQTPQAGQADPFVAAAEHAEGILATATWQSIFNGKDLAGWRGDTAGYTVEEGVLVCRKGGKTLETENEYGDFALTFEFRLEASGNNGIGIRVP